MTELHDRIREAAVDVGGLQKLADLAGIPRRTLGHWLRGKQPKPEDLAKIADAASISVAWLVTGRGAKTEDAFSAAMASLDHRLPSDEEVQADEAMFTTAAKRLELAGQLNVTIPSVPGPDLSKMAFVPRFDVQASAGAGALIVSEQVSDYFSVSRDWLRRQLPSWAPLNSAIGFLDGSGDSMEPTIRDGDMLMIVLDVEWRIVERGGIFVFSLDDRVLLKRLQVLATGDLMIISDNKAYQPDTIIRSDIEHRIRIHGMVFFSGGRPRNM